MTDTIEDRVRNALKAATENCPVCGYDGLWPPWHRSHDDPGQDEYKYAVEWLAQIAQAERVDMREKAAKLTEQFKGISAELAAREIRNLD